MTDIPEDMEALRAAFMAIHDVEPNAYLTDVVSRLVNGHPQSRLAELTPWAWKAAHASS